MRLQRSTIGLVAALSISAFSAFAQPAPAIPAYTIVGSIAGPDGPWDYVSIDAVARRLYVARGSGVMAVDLDSGVVTPQLIEGHRVHIIVALPNGRALSTNGETNTATLFAAATGKLIAEVPTGKGPDAALFDPPSGLALVMDHAGGDITLVDPNTGGSPGGITVGGTLEFAATDGQGRVFVAVESTNELAVVDTAARKVVAHYALSGCEKPTGLAIDPQTAVLVAACANQKAVALDARDGHLIAELAIGKRPDATLFDPVRKLFLIPCGGDGTLRVIAENDGVAPAVVASIPTAMGARTGAVDPKTGRIYLPTADFQPPVSGQRAVAVPGTFRVLIVARGP